MSVDPQSRALWAYRALSASVLPLLIQEQSGTHKELLARDIPRERERGGRFFALSCAALCVLHGGPSSQVRRAAVGWTSQSTSTMRPLVPQGGPKRPTVSCRLRALRKGL